MVICRAIGATLLVFCSFTNQADIYKFVDSAGDSFYAGDPPLVQRGSERINRTRNSAYSYPSYPYSEFILDALGQPAARSVKFRAIIEREAMSAGLDPDLLHSVIDAESSYDPTAVSEKGALGLMQLMPATIQRFGVTDPYDPVQNIKGGAKYLSHLIRIFDSDVSLALAAYNAGEGRVLRYGKRLPPFDETRDYVSKVLRSYHSSR